jgi:hypothetical protein
MVRAALASSAKMPPFPQSITFGTAIVSTPASGEPRPPFGPDDVPAWALTYARAALRCRELGGGHDYFSGTKMIIAEIIAQYACAVGCRMGRLRSWALTRALF